jgi:hypothetical protein
MVCFGFAGGTRVNGKAVAVGITATAAFSDRLAKWHPDLSPKHWAFP